jgi:hypothetical protein
MNRELRVRRHGDAFRIVCYDDYMGAFDGRVLSRELGLAEIPPPAGGNGSNGLAVGQCYLLPLTRHRQELHAVITPEQLAIVADLVRELHFPVTEGADLFPALEGPEPGSAPGEIEAGTVAPRRRRRAGPLAIFAAAIGTAALVVAPRHLGDHHETLPAGTVFARAAVAPRAQGALERLLDPDHSAEVRLEIQGLRFIDRNRLIFEDGTFAALDGVPDLGPLADLAASANLAPVVDARAGEGKVMIEEVRVGKTVFARGGELRRIAQLAPSAREPARSRTASDHAFLLVSSLPHDRAAAIRPLLGQRISLSGRVQNESGHRVLRLAGGSGVLLTPLPAGSPVELLLAAFTGDPAELEVDLVLRRILPWENRKDPALSRRASRLVAEAEVLSASAQGYHTASD